MCGILGALPPADPFLFKKALNTLTHRGPDGDGIKTLPEQIMMGHRRLAIVDLSSRGSQPMVDTDGRYWIVFNGEIYNFIELRRELQSQGITFYSKSDTEVLLNAYRFWGTDCLLRFNGMWAFAIWDQQKRQLFLSRDRFGKKPLFYAFVGQQFIFASEMKAIFPFLKEVKPSTDFPWMRKHIMEYESTDKCLVAGIKRFPAGHYGTMSAGKLKLRRYWNTLDHLAQIPVKYADQVEQFRSLFFDACKIRMRSDVPLGTALSGGLDSSAIISVMAQVDSRNDRERWQNAFVASFPGTPLDETGYALQAAAPIGIHPHILTIDPRKEWDHLFDHLYQFEELYLTSPLPMMMLYQFVKENGVIVTLDGHGADELFSGYGHLLEALLDVGFNRAKSLGILNIFQGTRRGFSQTPTQSNLEIYLKFMLKKLRQRLKPSHQKFPHQSHPNFHRLDHLSQELYKIFHVTTLPTLLRNYDRYSMSSGIEVRMPFMDYRIVCFITSLPYTSKIGNGYTKKLLRDALAPFMPPVITWRKSKIGFNTPLVNWMQNELKDWFGDLVRSREFRESNMIENPTDLGHRIETISSGKDSLFLNAEQVWKDLAPFLWEQAVLKRGVL